jgi:hypothetical protein
MSNAKHPFGLTFTPTLPNVSLGEERHARAILSECARLNLQVEVQDEKDMCYKRGAGDDVALDTLAASDENLITLFQQEERGWRQVGWLLLIWSNAPDGSELVADYSANDFTCAFIAEVETLLPDIFPLDSQEDFSS